MGENSKEKRKQAIALQYNPGEVAPKIIASGTGAVAEKIIDKAKETASNMQTSSAQKTPTDNTDYIMEQINKLFEMKEKGILTEEEFTAKKAEYLSKL